jgi:hypothetical protein
VDNGYVYTIIEIMGTRPYILKSMQGSQQGTTILQRQSGRVQVKDRYSLSNYYEIITRIFVHFFLIFYYMILSAGIITIFFLLNFFVIK